MGGIRVAILIGLLLGAFGLFSIEATANHVEQGDVPPDDSPGEVTPAPSNDVNKRRIVGSFDNSLSAEDIQFGVSNIYFEHSSNYRGIYDNSLSTMMFYGAKKVTTTPRSGIRSYAKEKIGRNKASNVNMILDQDPKIREVIKFKGRNSTERINPATDFQTEMNYIGDKSVELAKKRLGKLGRYSHGDTTKIINRPQSGKKRFGGKARIFFDGTGEVKVLKINGKKVQYVLR